MRSCLSRTSCPDEGAGMAVMKAAMEKRRERVVARGGRGGCSGG